MWQPDAACMWWNGVAAPQQVLELLCCYESCTVLKQLGWSTPSWRCGVVAMTLLVLLLQQLTIKP